MLALTEVILMVKQGWAMPFSLTKKRETIGQPLRTTDAVLYAFAMWYHAEAHLMLRSEPGYIVHTQ